MSTTPRKKQSAFRLSDEGLAILKAIADDLGVNMTSALEVVLREYANQHGMRQPAQRPPQS